MSKSLKKLIDINRLREFKNKLPVFESWPAGVIIPFAGTSVPTGYLLCNGAAVSRTNYANLFAAIGTLYGAGDGSTVVITVNNVAHATKADQDGNGAVIADTYETKADANAHAAAAEATYQKAADITLAETADIDALFA